VEVLIFQTKVISVGFPALIFNVGYIFISVVLSLFNVFTEEILTQLEYIDNPEST
jgi:hypothetical protein